MKITGALALTFLGCASAHAGDGFEKVRCGGDIVKALVGQHAGAEPVAKIEARHKDLNLKDLGADEVSDSISSISWRICGTEFVVLEDNRNSTVHDVLQVPSHSASHREFLGSCKLKGKPMPGLVFAILADQARQKELPADAAWKIDEKAIRFIKMSPDDLLCPRDGVWDRPAN